MAGCSNRPPKIQPVGPQSFAVGVRGEIEFRAFDPDGDPLTWKAEIPGLADEYNRSTMSSFVDKAIFTFTPLAGDVGQHQLDVSVSDGTAQDLLSVPITIRPGAPGEGQPKFIRPLGQGITFYVDQNPCIDIDVLIEDVDSLNVAISQDPPIPGSEIRDQVQGAKTAQFHWCPSEQQKLTTRHVLYLIADDGDNPPVHVNDGQGYYILLERGT